MALCQTHFIGLYMHACAIPYSSLIKITSRANKEVLAAHSQPCQMLTGKKRSQTFMCTRGEPCPEHVFTTLQ